MESILRNLDLMLVYLSRRYITFLDVVRKKLETSLLSKKDTNSHSFVSISKHLQMFFSKLYEDPLWPLLYLLILYISWNLTKYISKRFYFSTTTQPNLFYLAKTASQPGHRELLIKELGGMNINYSHPGNGLTLLLAACLGGDGEMVAYLIDKGADCHQRTFCGDGAIYLATFGILTGAKSEDTALIRILIDNGCDVNQQNNLGFTPLHRAASLGSLKVVEFLLKEHGANPLICNNNGSYPVNSAADAGQFAIKEYIEQYMKDFYHWEDSGRKNTPLHQDVYKTPTKPKHPKNHKNLNL